MGHIYDGTDVASRQTIQIKIAKPSASFDRAERRIRQAMPELQDWAAAIQSIGRLGIRYSCLKDNEVPVDRILSSGVPCENDAIFPAIVRRTYEIKAIAESDRAVGVRIGFDLVPEGIT
jgi:hypothetical protein